MKIGFKVRKAAIAAVHPIMTVVGVTGTLITCEHSAGKIHCLDERELMYV